MADENFARFSSQELSSLKILPSLSNKETSGCIKTSFGDFSVVPGTEAEGEILSLDFIESTIECIPSTEILLQQQEAFVTLPQITFLSPETIAIEEVIAELLQDISEAVVAKESTSVLTNIIPTSASSSEELVLNSNDLIPSSETTQLRFNQKSSSKNILKSSSFTSALSNHSSPFTSYTQPKHLASTKSSSYADSGVNSESIKETPLQTGIKTFRSATQDATSNRNKPATVPNGRSSIVPSAATATSLNSSEIHTPEKRDADQHDPRDKQQKKGDDQQDSESEDSKKEKAAVVGKIKSQKRKNLTERCFLSPTAVDSGFFNCHTTPVFKKAPRAALTEKRPSPFEVFKTGSKDASVKEIAAKKNSDLSMILGDDIGLSSEPSTTLPNPSSTNTGLTFPNGMPDDSSTQPSIGSIFFRFMALMSRILGQAEAEAHSLYLKIKDRTDNIDLLTLFSSKINNVKGAINWEKDPEMRLLVDKVRDLGVAIPEGKYSWTESEKPLLKENIQMKKDGFEKVTQLERTDMQRYLQESSQCHQARSNVLKLLKEVIDTFVHNVRP